MNGSPASRPVRGILTRLLARLSVGRKLMLIYLLDLTAVIFISGILVQEKFIAIDFARKELAGDAYIVAAKDALIVAAQPGRTDKLAAQVDASVDVVEQAETHWGSQFDSHTAETALVDALHRFAAVDVGTAPVGNATPASATDPETPAADAAPQPLIDPLTQSFAPLAALSPASSASTTVPSPSTATAPSPSAASGSGLILETDIDGGRTASAHAPGNAHAPGDVPLRLGGPALAGGKSAPQAGAVSAVYVERQRDAIARARELITLVGNQSNLILDPDLDSYYTMSVILLRYPELTEIVSRISRLRTPVGTQARSTTADDRTQYLILEGRLIAVAQDIEADHSQAFAGATDGRLKDALSGPLRDLLASIEAFRMASGKTLEPGAAGAETAAMHSAQTVLLTRLDASWRDATTELDRLLDARIDGFFHRMWWHLGTALTLLMAILTAVFFVARQIARPLSRLSGVAERVRSSGDYTLRAQWDSGDEIGKLVIAFNGMLAQLDRHRATQQELVATARAASAQQQLIESMPIAMVVTAIPGHEVLHANRQAQAWLGDSKTDPWATGMEPGVRPRFFQELADRLHVDEFEVRWQGGAGPEWSVLSARRLTYQGQDAILTAFTPIGHLKLMEQRLELWAKVFEASSEGIVIVDAQRRIVTANSAFCRHIQHDLAELVGTGPEAWVSVDNAHDPEDMWPAPGRRASWRGEVRVRRRDDSVFPAWLVTGAVLGAGSEVSHYIWTMLDITERKASEERIHFLAHHDALTKLPNRQLFAERLRMAMQQAQRSGHKVAVLFIDLDRFKTINDSLGHHVGDAVLRSVSARLIDSVREEDTVSRLGGDEFVIALNGVTSGDEVLGLIQRRLMPAIRDAHLVDGAELHVSCSIGIAMYPDDASDIDDLMRHADVAMYQAKAMGRDSAHFFTPELNERAHTRLKVELELRHAIDRNELFLHYQPRIGAVSGEVVGVEALLRWNSRELGAVAPADFIPIAEESRLIVRIGAWVVDQACRQQAQWKSEGLGEIGISINVSAVQLRDPSFASGLQESLSRWGADPAGIELELTESTVMEDVMESLCQLQALKRLGVKLSVDDFGTGYSSLVYLHRFPIDRLKIDRSFVANMLDDPTDLAITRAIIGLGHTLGLQVVAEGVESEAVAAALRNAECDELQGYLYSEGIAPEALSDWISQRRAGTLQAASDPITIS